MISNRQTLVLLAVCQLLMAACAFPARGAPKTPDRDFEAIGKEHTLVVRGDVEQLCNDVLGYEYPVGTIIYRRSKDISAWQVATKGKHGLITSCIIIEKGKIADCLVLSSKEVGGKQVTARGYLRQFTGLSLLASSKLSKRVDAISGATITSKAVTDAAILALRLEEKYRAVIDPLR